MDEKDLEKSIIESKRRSKKQYDKERKMSFLATKNRLLEEVLTKKNFEIEDIKDNNEGLVQVLEEYELSKHKYEQELEVLKLKLEKYEIKYDGKDDKIDVDSLDGRVNFLVNLLEEYRQKLEEDVRREKERGDFDRSLLDESLIDYDDKEIFKQLTKQNSV